MSQRLDRSADADLPLTKQCEQHPSRGQFWTFRQYLLHQGLGVLGRAVSRQDLSDFVPKIMVLGHKSQSLLKCLGTLLIVATEEERGAPRQPGKNFFLRALTRFHRFWSGRASQAQVWSAYRNHSSLAGRLDLFRAQRVKDARPVMISLRDQFALAGRLYY